MADQEASEAFYIKNTLRQLVLDHFRGATVLEFTIRVLAIAAALTSLDLIPCAALPQTRVVDARALLLDCSHGSADCVIRLFEQRAPAICTSNVQCF